MQDQVKKYDDEDWEKAVYLIDRGFIKGSHADKYEDIRETAENIHTVKMRGYDKYIKNGGKPPFENKT
jgi:hypothetical protein